MAALFKKMRKRFGSLAKGMEDLQEAITYAEAGEPISEKKQEVFSAAPTHNLLVMGRESDFSQNVIDYAVDMAKRMSFDIIALNTAPLPCNSYKSLTEQRNKLCEQFKGTSSENAQKFRQAADEANISFHHVVKFKDPEDAMVEVQQEHPGVEFIISDEPLEVEREQIAAEVRPQNQVFVSAMI